MHMRAAGQGGKRQDGEADSGAANAPHRRTEKRLKEAGARSNEAANNEADDQTKALEIQEPLLSTKIPSVSVVFRTSPLGPKRRGSETHGKMAQQSRFGGGLHQNMSADIVSNEEAQCKSKMPVNALEGGLEGSRDGFNPRFQAPSPRGAVLAGAGRSDGRSVESRNTLRCPSPWEGTCASTASKQVFIVRA